MPSVGRTVVAMYPTISSSNARPERRIGRAELRGSERGRIENRLYAVGDDPPVLPVERFEATVVHGDARLGERVEVVVEALAERFVPRWVVEDRKTLAGVRPRRRRATRGRS